VQGTRLKDIRIRVDDLWVMWLDLPAAHHLSFAHAAANTEVHLRFGV
jgi:hypothetical protein